MTAKQHRFVNEYLIDLNATQAAIRAGYSPKRADAIGYENLRKPEIASAVAEAQRERAERLRIDAKKVLADLDRRGHRAEQAGQYAAAIQASVWQGKHLGMFVKRHEVSEPSPESARFEARRRGFQIAIKDPEMRERFAETARLASPEGALDEATRARLIERLRETSDMIMTLGLAALERGDRPE